MKEQAQSPDGDKKSPARDAARQVAGPAERAQRITQSAADARVVPYAFAIA